MGRRERETDAHAHAHSHVQGMRSCLVVRNAGLTRYSHVTLDGMNICVRARAQLPRVLWCRRVVQQCMRT
jgi:hypothetical protein